MKCPKCGNPKYKYVQEKKTMKGSKTDKKTSMQTSHTARCNKCGYEE